MKKNDKQRLFEVMARLDKTFKPTLNEGFSSMDLPIVPSEEDVYNLIPKAIRWGFITKEEFEADKDRFISAAAETAEEWKDAEEIGSSDMTYMMKEFLSDAGIKTDFVNNRLTRIDNPVNPKINENTAGKKTFTINLWGEEDEVFFDLDTYANNDTMAVELVTTMGEPYATVSTNLPESEDLPDGEFFLKDWSENEPIAKALIDMGAIIPTGKSASSGFVVAKSYKINPEYL